jgi:hypothetical protein
MTEHVDKADQMPEEGSAGKGIRGALQIASGAIPFAGGVLSAIAGAWSEKEQARVNEFFKQWVRALEEELKEKETTIIEIAARIDLQDEKIAERVQSREFQSLIKKTFREWAGAESEEKRLLIRNLLSNAAASTVSSDHVIRMFIDWIGAYSELHFKVIGVIYNSNGISRGEIWRKIGKGRVQEDSADADLYKLLIRDLSTGSVIRQHRETDYYGNFLAKPNSRKTSGSGQRQLKSAFDEEEMYELTELGQQFVHYAMTELTPRIEFNTSTDSSASEPPIT